MPLLSPDELKAELAQVKPADPMVAGSHPFPYIALSSDDFERLGYALCDAAPSFRASDDWNSATLMLRGSDAGRDVALFRQQQLIGVVQCKRLESGMTLPAVFRELAKLVLFPHSDSGLPKIEPGLRYLLMLSRDPAGTVVDFFDRPDEVLASKKSAISDAVDEVLEAYATLASAFPDLKTARDLVAAALPTLNYKLLRPHALDLELQRLPAVAGAFFHQRVVVDNTVLQDGLGKLEDLLASISRQTEGVAFLTDADLRIIKERIEQTPESHRLNLGFASTFGLPREMFSTEADLKARAERILQLSAEIHSDLTDWLFAYAGDKAEAIAVYNAHIVPPFALQLVRGFTGLVARDALQTSLANGKMGELAAKIFGFQPAKNDSERLQHVYDELLEQGRRYLAGDWSKLQGDEDLIALKKSVIMDMLASVADEAELEKQMQLGLEYLKPHLMPVAEKIRELGGHPISIVVTGLDSLGSSDVVDQLAATVLALDGMMPKARKGPGGYDPQT